MTTLTLGAASLNLTALDFTGNRKIICAAIREAKDRGVQILCLPELCITGYGCEDGFLFPHIQETALKSLIEILPESGGIAVSLGLPISFNGELYNGAAFIADKKIIGIACKQNLAGDGIHYEPRWFTPWKRGEIKTIEIGGAQVPIGDLVFDFNDAARVGFEICEDAWVFDRPSKGFAKRGVDIILNPSASHFALGKYKIRKTLITEGSVHINGVYIFANHLGNEAGRAIYDGDTVIAQNGKIIAAGPRFSFKDYTVTSETLEIPLRSRSKCADAVTISLKKAKSSAGKSQAKQPGWENSPALRFEEFTRAVSLGLLDYLRKSKSEGFLISLSGGADSTAVTLLSYCMVVLSLKELGTEKLQEKLDYITTLKKIDSDPHTLMNQLVTCVYQATKNSSETTLLAAQTMAERLHAQFHALQLDSILDGYHKLIEEVVGRNLNWEGDDLALQNVQARVRSPSIWLLANIKKALLLTTVNRSECVVGYASMDGDTSGGLAPICGIDKYFIQQWLSWMETVGIEEIGSISELEVVTSQQPTAELRPKEANQTDEKDLMPYKVLVQLEYAILRDRKSPEQAAKTLVEIFDNEFSTEQLSDWTKRFLNLWRISQWKRERLAPSFHLDDFSIDPKTWARFPILNGGL